MTCNEAQQLLTAYADKALDAAIHQEVENHLANCEECRRELEEINQLLDAIDQTIPVAPGAAMRENFTAMLQAEINILATENLVHEHPPKKGIYISMQSLMWRAAAACIILGVGILIGTRISGGNANTADVVAEIKKELKEVKETAMVNMLDDESASQRLQAVSYTEGMNNPNKKVTDALVNTLNTDKNVNVRLAALYSLAKFTGQPGVNDSLIASLGKQTEPIIQVVLINILVEKKETRAIQPIRQILQNDKTLKEVKEAAQKGLKAI